MTDLTPNHPAVEAAHTASQAWMDDVACKLPRDEMVYILSAALPHLTADDLRDTPAGRALMAEAWAHATFWERYPAFRRAQDAEVDDA